jgi:AcrR family transcriptional regulator
LATMSDPPPAKPRRRRADALHNAEAILDAASRVLAERPEAGLAEVAKASGISRQTLYAHYPSREAVIRALIERATERVVAAFDAADLESGPADLAVVRLMEIGWQSFDIDPFLLNMSEPRVSAEEDRGRHAPILQRMLEVIVRGQREGDIDPALAAGWVLASVFALGYAASEEARAGRMSSDEAVASLRVGILRLVRPGSGEPPATPVTPPSSGGHEAI